MAIRRHYLEELEKLQKGIIEMGALTLKAFEQSVEAFRNHDVESARFIIANDEQINRLEVELNEKCAVLIAEEQPVAKDLRIILNAVRACYDLERIADNAVHVSKCTVNLAGESYIEPVKELMKMPEIVFGMLRDSLDVYLTLDTDKAREISMRDRQVDRLYRSLFGELVEYMHAHPDKIDQGLAILFLGRRFERIADHTTHICEGAVYTATGKHIELKND
ncbi:MAG: phosphate signaling complex protein PhoU [Spirochaetes bacterium]|nr:phosphate signaling complex protein PhoU [Spirochaetota bacterium]